MSQSPQDETTRTPEMVEEGTMSGGDASPSQPSPDGPTIGTGTSLALGCVAGTILLIAIGLIYILILAIV